MSMGFLLDLVPKPRDSIISRVQLGAKKLYLAVFRLSYYDTSLMTEKVLMNKFSTRGAHPCSSTRAHYATQMPSRSNCLYLAVFCLS